MNSQKPDALDDIVDMLRALHTDNSCMPSTYLYNEGWMLRLILKAASDGLLGDLIPACQTQARWSSEAKLFTPFDQSRGKAAEGPTNVDGIVGDFDWEPGTQTGVRLSEQPNRFEIFEAKMFSKLSPGVSAAKWYDQAVRNVACMAQTLALRNLKPQEHPLPRIAFWVLAPQSQISRRRFATELSPGAMRAKIAMRIAQFSGPNREALELWHEDFFEPLLQQLEEAHAIKCVSWEDLIEGITDSDRKTSINDFYRRCLEAARHETRTDDANRPSRGQYYRVSGMASDQLVVVCNAGQITSRVFVPDGLKPSFPIQNGRLQPADDELPMTLQIPPVGAVRIWKDKTVRVTSNGPCRSKVEDISAPGPTELVDNHLLALRSTDWDRT